MQGAMKWLFNSFTSKTVLGLIFLNASLLVSTIYFRSAYIQLKETLTLKDQIIAEHQANQQRLKKLFDQYKLEAEKRIQTEEAKSKKARDKFNAELKAHRDKPVEPVYIRVQQHSESESSSRSSSSDRTKETRNGSIGSSQRETSLWVLSKSNSERLESALMEVEELSRDFNRAKEQLEICLSQ